MEIHRQNFQSPKFTSRVCPIKPSVVNTKWGKLTLEEVKPIDIIQKGFFENLAAFFGKNFNSPDWQIFKDPTKKSELNMVIENFAQNLKALFKNNDGNLTLLVARDKQKRIQGACLSYGYDLVPNSKDSPLSKQDKSQQKVINFIALDRFDYPKFVDFLSKPLKPNQERWYNRVAEVIDDSWL